MNHISLWHWSGSLGSDDLQCPRTVQARELLCRSTRRVKCCLPARDVHFHQVVVSQPKKMHTAAGRYAGQRGICSTLLYV